MKKFAKKLLSVSLSAVMLVTSTGTLALAEQGENVIQEDIKNEENSEELIEENSPEETLPEEIVQEENFSEENIPPESPKEEETAILPENGETENSVILETPQEVPLEETPEVNAEGAYAIYQTHIEEIGWQGFRSKGEISGTVNEGKRLEAIEIKTNRPGLGIEYKTHIQDIGWETSMKKNGEQSGTTGQRKKIEAIRIVLTGAEKGKYDVYYQVQAQNFGWLDFAKNGEDAGTAGKNLRLEAIKIIIQEKGTPAPGGTDAPFLSGEPGSSINASYSTHVQDIGWQAPINNGEVSGTVGKAKQLEGIKIKIPNVKGLGVQYQSHIQNIGWQEWKADNEMSGTEKQGLQLEAIKIKLTGNTARFYDIYSKPMDYNRRTYGIHKLVTR